VPWWCSSWRAWCYAATSRRTPEHKNPLLDNAATAMHAARTHGHRHRDDFSPHLTGIDPERVVAAWRDIATLPGITPQSHRVNPNMRYS